MSSVERASVKRLLDRQRIRIPTLPTILTRIDVLLQDPEAGVDAFGEVIDTDPPLAARVLKTANSAFYGHAETVRSTGPAVMTIGTRVLRVLVLQASLIARYEHLSGSEDLDPDTLWRHSILTAQLSQHLAGILGARPGLAAEPSYTAGLLHDIGKIILLDGLGEEYLAIVHEARVRNEPSYAAETRHLGFDHAHLGGIVARRWGLPKQTVEAVERHHDHARPTGGNLLVPLLANADAVANRVQDRDPSGAQSALASPGNGLPALQSSSIVDAVGLAERTWPKIAV